MMQPAKLLQNLCVIRISVENPPVRRLCGVVLEAWSANTHRTPMGYAYIFLLLMYMANLEPDILFSEWSWRVGHYVFEALRGFSMDES